MKQNYDELIETAGEKIKEIEAINQKENEELKKLLKLRGDVLANGEIGLIDLEREKKNIYELTKKVRDLKDQIEENNFTLTSLKEKIILLQKDRQEQELEEAKALQNKIELDLAKASEKLISQMKEAHSKNQELQELHRKWKEVNQLTNKTTFGRKISLGSEQMLNIIYQVLALEWSSGDLAGRHRYQNLVI